MLWLERGFTLVGQETSHLKHFFQTVSIFFQYNLERKLSQQILYISLVPRGYKSEKVKFSERYIVHYILSNGYWLETLWRKYFFAPAKLGAELSCCLEFVWICKIATTFCDHIRAFVEVTFVLILVFCINIYFAFIFLK